MEKPSKQNLIKSWKVAIPNIYEILQKMQEKTIVAIGITPYVRIIPALFLDNYNIYCVKKTTDIKILKNYAKIFCLEDKFPKVAPKVHSTNYLLRNYAFQAFLKSRKNPLRLMFYQITPRVAETLKEQKLEWIGNTPESFEDVLLKADFRDVIKKLGLSHLKERRIPRDKFLSSEFKELYAYWNSPVVIQRADFDVGGEQGTFFIKAKQDLTSAHKILSQDERFKEVQISPLIEGLSVSMLGCITPQGVLTSPLQLQLIDVPEALHGQLATGVFLGHDWGFRSWNDSTEDEAQHIVESVGTYLADKGYKGIFGIDFMYEEQTKKLFPIECNPRFTGALPIYSLMILEQGKVPPMEFFHIATHLGIETPFDFEYVNEYLKKRQAISHISLTPKGIYEMKLRLTAGIYSMLPEQNAIRYERPGALLSDIKKSSEFLIIDSVQYQGDIVMQNVPRLFKLIFTSSIAQSSFQINPEIGKLITSLSTALRKDQQSNNESE